MKLLEKIRKQTEVATSWAVEAIPAELTVGSKNLPLVGLVYQKGMEVGHLAQALHDAGFKVSNNDNHLFAAAKAFIGASRYVEFDTINTVSAYKLAHAFTENLFDKKFILEAIDSMDPQRLISVISELQTLENGTSSHELTEYLKAKYPPLFKIVMNSPTPVHDNPFKMH